MMKNWEVIEIGELGKVVTGKTPLTIKPEYWNGDIPFITPGDITDYKYISETERKVTGEGVKNTTTLLPPNTLIIVCIGSTIGKVALTNKECITNQQINSVIIDLTRFDPNYLYYAFSMVSKQFKYNSGTAAVPIIKKSLFEKYLLTVPPLDEQRRISKVLSLVDEAIQKADEAITKTERIKQAMLRRLFSKDLEIIGIKEIGIVSTGKTPSSFDISLWNGNIPFVTPGDISDSKYVIRTERTISDKGSKVTTLLPRNSLMVVCIGSTIGKVALTSKNMTTNQQINSIIINEDKFDANFIYYSFLNSFNLFRALAGTAAVPIINKTLFEKFKISISNNKKEQIRIGEILSSLDDKLLLEQSRKVKLERIKQGLMDDLLTGKKRVKIN